MTVAVGAGKRDKLVTIQTVVAVETPGEFPTGTVTTLGEEWMARTEPTGLEAFAAAQISARYDALWICPYRADMDPDIVDVPKERRLIFRGQHMDIVGARLLENDAEIELRTVASSRIEA